MRLQRVRSHRILACLLAFSLFLLFASHVQAIPVAGTSVSAADWLGTRSVTSDGLTGNQAYANAFTISWTVTQTAGIYHYDYLLSNLSKNLSHLLLQTCNATGTALWNITQPFDSTAPRTYSPSDPGNSNPGLPADLFGFKFNGAAGDTYQLAFDSSLAPVWGDFYAKSGRDSYAFNDGLADPTSADLGDFIVVPGAQCSSVVPEPATLGLFGAGLALLGFCRRHARRGLDVDK